MQVDIREVIRENHHATCNGEDFKVITKAGKKDGQKAECSFLKLYRSADTALYQIKNEQKNGIAVLG